MTVGGGIRINCEHKDEGIVHSQGLPQGRKNYVVGLPCAVYVRILKKGIEELGSGVPPALVPLSYTGAAINEGIV